MTADRSIRTAEDGAIHDDAWRKARNQALRHAGYRCSRCGARSRLQVHPRADRPNALEVVCGACWGTAPLNVPDPSRLYLRLAREVAREARYETFVEWSDALKRRCWQLGFRPDPRAVDDALNTVGAGVLAGKPHACERRPASENSIGRGEARALLARLQAQVAVRSMPPLFARPEDAR